MYNTNMKKRLFSLILLISIGSLSAVETISLEVQMITPENKINRDLLNDILITTGARVSRIYNKYIHADIKNNFDTPADYQLQIMGVFDDENPIMVATFTKKSSGESLSQTLMGTITSDSSIYLSDVIFKLWADLNPLKISAAYPRPEFLEEVPSRYILEAGSPGATGYNTASSVAVKENGNIILGMSSYCFELSDNFNVVSQIGQDLIKQGNYTYAFGVSVTPGGTVYMKPTNGRDIYRAIEGVPRSMRIRAGIEVSGPIAVLNNGVIILLDLSARKFVRIEGNKRSNIDLNLGQYTYVMAMAGGPEGNLWIYDPIEQRIKTYSDDGTFINSIIPVGLKGETLSPLSMAIYDDGTILLYSNGALYKFNKEGILMWKMTGYIFRDNEDFPMTPINLAVDSQRGYIYMADYSASRILKFYDPGFNSTIAENQNIEKILSINSKINENPDSPDPIWEKIEYYLEQEAWILAKMWLEEVINLDPFDNRADSLLAEMELNSLLEQVEKLQIDTFDIIKRLGPESARQQYSQTVQLYEQILSLNPGNQKAINNLNRFKESYNMESATPGTQQKPLTIASIEIDNIFPSLIHYYTNSPVGKVIIKNDLDKTVFNVKAELNLRQFIDFPKESEVVSSLAPGEEKIIYLNILLNEKAFNIQEDLPVLAQVNISYEIDSSIQSVSQTTGATLYRRTALSWDNTAKLAAFIMPNEGIVSAFSHRVLDMNLEGGGLPSKLVKAARICDALGTYGISYVEDPDSPFSLILGKEQHVDTVRYPRTTLHIQSGDCDDTTALLTSLLESSGIGTAIMTSPGHVFLAFNTEEPVNNKWIFETEGFEIIEHEGTIWIPVESTVLSKGFYYAWSNASTIISQNKAEDIDFIPVKNQRETFPPLPLSESNLIVIEPGKEQIDVLYEQSIDSLRSDFYELNVKELINQIDQSSNRRQRQLNNKLGILHARFQNYGKAEDIFKKLIDDDLNYISPYINLGNMYYYRKEYDKALSIFEEAHDLKPDSVMLNLALAKTFHKLNDMGNTEKFFNIVRTQSEDLSDKFAYLVNDNGAVRAGIDSEPPIEWDTEE